MPNKKNAFLAACLLSVSLTMVSAATAADAGSAMFEHLRQAQQAIGSEKGTTATDIYRYPDGTQYSGDWKYGVPHGDGKLKLANGTMYIGAFRRGVPDGTGILQETDGDLYQGEWKQGMRDGMGMMEYANGNRYEGQWKQDKREGEGVLVFPSGTRFEGEWKNDVRHGRGELRYKTGETYIGDYSRDVPHGYGTIVESDGSMYAGTFSKGKRHGVGDCTDAAGRTDTCVYDKGVRVEKAAVVSRASAFKTKFEPQFQFTDGVALLWENNFSKGKGVLHEQSITFTKRAALLGSEMKFEAKGQNFFMLMVIKDYKGPGKYRLSGENLVVSIDGETPLFLAGNDAGEADITIDKETVVEGTLLVPKLYPRGRVGRESVAIRRGQFRALPSDFQALQQAAAMRPPIGTHLNIKKSNKSALRSHKPLVNGTQPADLEELIQQVNDKGKQQGGEDAVQPHGKR